MGKVSEKIFFHLIMYGKSKGKLPQLSSVLLETVVLVLQASLANKTSNNTAFNYNNLKH